jgi:hypothetical protein
MTGSVAECMNFYYLNMSIDEPIQFKVFVVVAKGIDQLLRNLSHYRRLIINFATFTITL